MSFQELMITYGYPILFLGVMLEGEAFLIAAAYLTHRGYFSLPVVIGIAALASAVITEVYFYIGHRYGQQFLAKRPRWQNRFNRVQVLLHQYGSGLLLVFRALYGLRAVIPAAVGLSNYPQLRFILLNIAGALLWATIIALAGNSLAQIAEVAFEDIRRHEHIIVIIIVILGAVYGLYQLYREPKLDKTLAGD